MPHVVQPTRTETSRRSGLPMAFGYTRHGRRLGVVYEMIDEVTMFPVTAYELEE